MTEKPLDCWADWLVSGRQRGMSDGQVRRLQRNLNRLRDRVLRGARLRAGQRLLDVGAGTGLLALDARRRVGPTGAAVALDVSVDALRQCAAQPAGADPAAPLHLVAGDALRLPFREGAFGAAVTRSVLIYVADKAAAIAELYRVLRPGGRASIFEPINEVESSRGDDFGLDLGALKPAHDRVAAHRRATWGHEQTMLGFDERDLARWFADAGFSSVRLTYEYGTGRRRATRAEVAMLLRIRPNPSMMSYEEAARATLDGAADGHLLSLAKLLTSQPLAGASAAAYVTARK